MTHRSREHSPELSPQDAALVDALVESGFQPGSIAGLGTGERRRVQAIASVFELLEDYPVEDADDTLVHATLARIDRHVDDRAARMSVEAAREAPRRRIRMPDFISVAAVILIGASVVWPLATHMRQRAIDTGCSDNLRRMGLAFDGYAADNEGTMPVARAGLLSHWLPSYRNVENLQPLVAGNYCSAGDMDCPGHEDMHGESYSYRWHLPDHRAMWGPGRGQLTLALADRNPLVDAFLAARVAAPLSLSINHGGRGQNVLVSDGRTVWLVQPVVGGNDNIWLPGRAPFLTPGLEVTDPLDAFLVP
jgi:hypothetical protein